MLSSRTNLAVTTATLAARTTDQHDIASAC
jgi:hypothetical protein